MGKTVFTTLLLLALFSCKKNDNGTIAALNCASTTNNGTLRVGSAASNVTSAVPYTGGNGGTYPVQTVSSTGVTGLTATLAAGAFSNGAGTLNYTITGTPSSSGTAAFAISIGGQSCSFTRVVNGNGSGPLNIETLLIPAGTFSMGSPTSELLREPEEEQHQVTLSAFRMSKYEISNALYATFLNARSIGSNGIYAAGAYPTEVLIFSNSLSGLVWSGTQWQPVAGKENFPAVNVSWYGATEFAAYAGGRLPTEAEWEYACRGGTATPFNTGNCLGYTQANYLWDNPYSNCSNANTSYPGLPQAIDSHGPNAYGLYNMHGNVWEWCADWYGPYNTAPQTNPSGPTTGMSRINRGGCYGNEARYCRSAFRNHDLPINDNGGYGVRLAFAP